MTASQRAKKKCGKHSNKSTTESKAAECCCMVAPWVIEEEKRSYKLKVTKPKQQEFNGKTKTVSEKEPHSNKKKNRYELQVVAPPVDKDGKVTYKKITSKHTFLHQCGLTMHVRSDGYDKSIAEGGSFEIDSDGYIKGSMKEHCKEKKTYTYFPNACTAGEDPNAKLKQLDEEIRMYEDMANNPHGSLLDAMRGTGASDAQRAQERYFAQCRIEVARLKQKALLAQQATASDPSQGERAGDVMDVLRSLFILPTSKELHLLPTGSSKCVDPHVVLCVYPSYTLKGSVSFSVAEQYITKALQNKGTQVVGGTKSADVALEIAQGSKRYAFRDGISIESPPRRVKNKVLYSSGILFGPLSKTVSKIYKASAAANKLSKHRKGKGSVSFDPGVTKFEFSAEDLMLAEDDKSYEAYWKGKATLGATLFEGGNLTLDLIPYVIGMGGPIGKLVEKAVRNASGALEGSTLAKHTKAELKLDAIITGSAKGALELDFKDKTTVTSTGSISGKVTFAIVGLIEAGLNAFGVEAGAGAGFKSGTAKSADDGTDITCTLSITQVKQGDMPTFGGDITTDGLAIYYSWYAYMKESGNDKNQNAGGKSRHAQKVSHTPELKFDANQRIPLVEPFSFIDEIKKHFPQEKHA